MSIFPDPCRGYRTLHIGVKVRLLSFCSARGAGSPHRVALVFSVVTALCGCGSQEDLVIGSIDFSLLRRDDFNGDRLDSDYWEVASHSFADNLAWFSPDNAKVQGGRLILSITDVPAPAVPMPNESPKPYSAAEVRTRVPFLYGRFRARARFAPGAGVVSAIFGFYDHYSMSSGSMLENQIVIESGLAEESPSHELRFVINVPVNGVEPQKLPVGFDPSADFHELGFDWTPTEVSFFVDGKSELTLEGEQAAQLREYERFVMSAYPSRAGWLDDFEPSQLPVMAEFDWVEISEYKGPRP